MTVLYEKAEMKNAMNLPKIISKWVLKNKNLILNKDCLICI